MPFHHLILQDLGIIVSLCKIMKLNGGFQASHLIVYTAPLYLHACIQNLELFFSRHVCAYVQADTSSVKIAVVVDPFFYPLLSIPPITSPFNGHELKLFKTHMQPHYAKH